MALWSKPGAMIDILTTDDLTCNNKHNTLYVQATMWLHKQVNGILETCTDMSGIYVVKQ